MARLPERPNDRPLVECYSFGWWGTSSASISAPILIAGDGNGFLGIGLMIFTALGRTRFEYDWTNLFIHVNSLINDLDFTIPMHLKLTKVDA